MLSVAEAQARIVERVTRLAEEDVSIGEAQGRVIARDVVATRALPGFDQSAMDGFALRAAETPGTLPVGGTIAAGARDVGALTEQTAVRIMTGAPMPPGADCVVIFEDAQVADGAVTVPRAAIGDNVRRRGEDVAIGDRVIERGARIEAGELGLLAALGFARVPCGRAPVVAIVATGDELVSIEDEPCAGEVVDSSAYALAAQIRDAGGVPVYLGIARDDRATVTAMIERALAHDVVVTTGGVSAGDRDYVRDALADAGVEPDFWKVAMKPGKPLAFGTRDRTPVFGLPGNPVSSMVAFELFARPALLAMQGAASLMRPRAPVILERGYHKPAGRAHYLRARVHRNGVGMIAVPHVKQGSHALTSMIGVDALVEIGANVTEIPPGGTAPAILLRLV
ncbi:MAG TPA: gephyrin-like molybdotransferase Glp [Kofleriaceae bacterium]|nr:gephyrin-like molybdotransferase Glp [Kofleriaceae bacterium]